MLARIVRLSMVLTLVMTVVTIRPSAAANATDQVLIASMADVIAHATSPEGVQAATAIVVPASRIAVEAAVATIAVPTDVPGRAVRSVIPTIEGLLVTDVYANAMQVTDVVTFVPTHGSPRTIARSDGFRSGVGVWTVRGSSSDGWTATGSSTADSPPGCDQCSAVGLVGGALYSTIVCLSGGFWSVLACNLVSGGIGIASDATCKGFIGCPGAEPKGMELNRVICNLTYCDYGVRVNKQGDTVIELGDTTYWYYPYAGGHGTYANKSNGNAAVVGHDTAYSDLNPSIDSLPERPLYEWRQDTTEPDWVACATDLQVSFTVRFANSSLQTTGYLPGQKPSSTGCPGYGTY
ncbi:MAG: hypothetical protein QOF60_327 [Actinomycetota bacterium]|jgi:hypothetical protein|nr:hypothetical protein [Actinomycetota bacterium]